jgi:hypothetical protein
MDLAAIVGDIDADIAATAAKPAKGRQFKQGMMQEPLARKVRPL